MTRRNYLSPNMISRKVNVPYIDGKFLYVSRNLFNSLCSARGDAWARYCNRGDSKESKAHAPLHWVGISGDEKFLLAVLAGGECLDVNVVDGIGRSGLNYAAEFGRLGVVKILMSSGADKRIVDNEGNRAVDYAKGNGHGEIVEFLDTWEWEAAQVGDEGASLQLPDGPQVWVVQENVLSGTIIGYCGKHERAGRFPSCNGGRDSKSATKQRYRKSFPWKALFDTWNFSATDPRDKIFGLYGLLNRTGQDKWRPDYHKSVEEVYAEAAKRIMLQSGELQMLSAAVDGSLRNIPTLPSLVPDYSMTYTHMMGAQYNAVEDLPKYPLRPRAWDVLRVFGVKIDTVLDIGNTTNGPSDLQMIFDPRWLEILLLVPVKYHNGQTRTQALWPDYGEAFRKALCVMISVLAKQETERAIENLKLSPSLGAAFNRVRKICSTPPMSTMTPEDIEFDFPEPGQNLSSPEHRNLIYYLFKLQCFAATESLPFTPTLDQVEEWHESYELTSVATFMSPYVTDMVSIVFLLLRGDSSSVTEYCPEERRQIGIISASFLVFNRIIGTGIFATPSAILALTGSVGLSLIIWIMGMAIAMTGTAVYLEFGTTIPRNGGEKNYLEYVYTKPRFLVTAMFASYALLLGWAAGNSVAFGEYVLHAADIGVNRWNQRGIGFACISVAFLIHATAVKWGLRLQNLLGVMKLIIILIIVIGGAMALGGHMNIEKPNSFTHPFEGSIPSVYGIVTALYSVIWSYIGYSNANYSLSETKNPARTLKIAAPIGVGLAGVLYMLVNVAYFAAVPKQDILGSGRILAASFFRNVFGPKAERILSVFVALCAFGNVQSVIFSQGRIIQELGREGVLPFSRFWASNRPFNSPAAGLFEHYVISAIVMLAPPPGDAYNFLLKYRLVEQIVIAPDGWSRQIITRVPIGAQDKGKAGLEGGGAGWKV
ncbi:hypothetical protein ACJ73_04225 [Blastomyces percursus]|uniref:Uncharacterized protein n=1 Tax=Blastomyces percursus TaxID=1658174 RepID=A0A1J9Q7G5_9EURO|nr:hypothetical protein ACJ73_04225 [Blastomyces percursus]